MTPKIGEETMTIQNPNTTSPTKAPNDGPDKDTSERRAKLGSEATRNEERKTTDLQEAGGSIAETLKKWRVELVRICRENPLTALGVAFMAGRMLRRRPRSK